MMKTYLFLFILFTGLTNWLSAQTFENYQVDKLGNNMWRIQATKGAQLSTAYLIEGSKAALLIDLCSGQEGLKEIVTGLIGTKPFEMRGRKGAQADYGSAKLIFNPDNLR